MKTKEMIHKGSDNVFADIGVTHQTREEKSATAHVLQVAFS